VRPRKSTALALGATSVLALGVAACGSSSDSSTSSSGGSTPSTKLNATLNGAGSTFAAPVYQTWGSKLGDSGLKLNYQATGSGAGVASLGQGTVDFAGSDPALAPDDVKTLTKGTPLQIPMFFGGITISYNLPGVKAGLKLDGTTAADIFLGKIKTWNDPAIKALNPGVDLPATKITVVHRSDSSGTTKGFTTFLSDSSSAFKSQVGADKDVKWPAGETGAKGNDGVAAAIKQTEGGVGYVEQAYALQNNFTYAAVKNSSGKFITPSIASVTAAGNGVKVPADLGISIINSPDPAAYPISSQTFIDVYEDMCKAGASASVAKGTKAFVDYGLGAGQDVAKQLSFAPLPASLKSKAQQAADKIKCNGSAVSASS
jgi:phosphate transport system substrate-binding protein